MATLKEIAGKIEGTLPEIQGLMAELELLAAQLAEGKLALRTNNNKVIDIKGKKLGYAGSDPKNENPNYNDAYAKKREKAGLLSSVKTMQFNKDGGKIFSNIRLGTTDSKPALGFIREEGALIAGYQEQQSKTKIFQLNDQERQEIKEAVREHLFKRLREITEAWR